MLYLFVRHSMSRTSLLQEPSSIEAAFRHLKLEVILTSTIFVDHFRSESIGMANKIIPL